MKPDPELVEHFRQVLAAQPKGTRGGYTLGYTVGAVREAADDHASACDGCSTCDHFEEILALLLAYELMEAPQELIREIHGMDSET